MTEELDPTVTDEPDPEYVDTTTETPEDVEEPLPELDPEAEAPGGIE